MPKLVMRCRQMVADRLPFDEAVARAGEIAAG
jgi:hypothetical protein